ncbi:helix-turn-helix domain-containing protein [Streptomyces sp. LP11]|uniref:Helix-turn-helix domain-containing protein n=1 Tax=Streptomyces pyxinicus TaxID=2970331 RepID=A0ABT2AYP3_9ACTN|nr:helix-turn-helix transcriptional regulator [Streptomyces sp. LP11]MCS0601345.1 helix-turn-helix domain-containing protein [Streptomyces sp. LP11]
MSKGSGGEPESSDSMRTFGAVVQALREYHGFTREEFGELIGYSKHTVASVELGRRMADPAFVDAAEPHLGDTGALRKSSEHLGRMPGLAAWFQRWAKLEKQAINLFNYECRMIPGLLQTEAYVRALAADQLPPLSDADIEDMWAARLERQRLLHDRPNTAFSFIIEEHTLLRGTGGVEATRDLIEHLLELAELRNVEIQVMRLVQASHAGLQGPIALVETPSNKWFAYSEGHESGLLISDSKVVSILQARYARMRSQARTLQDSVSLLEHMRGDL